MTERGAFQFELTSKKRKRASLFSDVSGQAREAKGDLIEIGALATCSILLNDPVVQEVHCVIRLAAGRFTIEDRGSATGTWVNGLEVREPRELCHGDQVVLGVSRLAIELTGADGEVLATSDGRPLVRIALEESAFFFAPKTSALFKKRSEEERGKEEALATKDQWVWAETRFGRSRALVVANWIGGSAVLLLVPLFLWTSIGETLVDPGRLSSVHAAVQAERDLDCGMCHASFEGPTVERCADCHAPLLDEGRHPFAAGGANLAAAVATEVACESCHREHQGEKMLQPAAHEVCGDCHAAEELEPETMHAALIARDGRVARRTLSARPTTVAYNEFSHASHLAEGLDIACSACHVRAEGEALGRAREFQPVVFETCMTCHDRDRTDERARWPGLADLQWEVRWHGSDDPAKCLQCHARLHEGELRSHETLDVEPLAWTLQRRDHAEHFALGSGTNRCTECHAAGTVPAVSVERASFWHGLHMRALAPADPTEEARVSAADCLACHAEVRDSASLATLSRAPYYAGSSRERCSECHRDAEGASLALALAPDQTPRGSRARPDFPHGPHVGTVAGECFACHAFELPAEARPFEQQATTTREGSDCLTCHADHDRIAGGACGACHGFADERWSLGPPEDERRFSVFRNPALLKDWTSGALAVAGAAELESAVKSASAFDHFSLGHRPATEEGRCSACHAGRDGRTLAAAQSVLDVPIPLESDDGCRQCHVLERGRFHWE